MVRLRCDYSHEQIIISKVAVSRSSSGAGGGTTTVCNSSNQYFVPFTQ